MNKLTQELNKANDHIAFLSQITNEKVEKYGFDFLKTNGNQNQNQNQNETDYSSKGSRVDIQNNLNRTLIDKTTEIQKSPNRLNTANKDKTTKDELFQNDQFNKLVRLVHTNLELFID